MKSFLAAVALTLAFSVNALADTKGEVDAMLAAYHVAWSRSDAATLSKFFTRDAEMVDPSGTAEGTAEIASHFGTAFAHGMANSTLETRVERVVPVRRDVLYGRGLWRITLASGGTPICGRFVAVLRRDAGQLRIADYNEFVVSCGKIAF